MNLEKALQVLNWSEVLTADYFDEWREAFVFQTANEIMSKMHAFPLVKKRVEDLEIKHAALFFLGLEAERKTPVEWDFQSVEPLDFMRISEKRTSEIKRDLLAARELGTLLRVSEELSFFLNAYMRNFSIVFGYSFPTAEEHVLSKEVLDSALVIRDLKSGQWSEAALTAIAREKKRLALLLSLSHS
jgi:hypothetical protein